jgi:hypothetical protein
VSHQSLALADPANVRSGAWLVMPLYIIYVSSVEILHGLHLATQMNAKSVFADHAVIQTDESKEQ